MIKLGDYSEEVAKKLVSDLRKVGIKYDTRSHFKITHFRTDSLEGRLSQLKEVLKDTQKIERTLNALKSALAQNPEPPAHIDVLPFGQIPGQLSPESSQPFPPLVIAPAFRGAFPLAGLCCQATPTSQPHEAAAHTHARGRRRTGICKRRNK